jgi:hypothetical protein
LNLDAYRVLADQVTAAENVLEEAKEDFSVPVIMPPKMVLLSCYQCCDRSHCLSSVLSSSCFGVMSSVG